MYPVSIYRHAHCARQTLYAIHILQAYRSSIFCLRVIHYFDDENERVNILNVYEHRIA